METNDKRQTISENRASQQIDQGVMYSSSPDDKLSENIWFVWSKTLYSVDKCGTTNSNRTKIGLSFVFV